MHNIKINMGIMHKGEIQLQEMHFILFDILFFLSFIFGLITLILTQHMLANGGLEIAPVTSLAIYQYELAVEWVFAIKWAFFFFIYYLFRCGNIIKTKHDAIAGSLFFFMMFFFCFVNMWNDILIFIYQL